MTDRLIFFCLFFTNSRDSTISNSTSWQNWINGFIVWKQIFISIKNKITETSLLVNWLCMHYITTIQFCVKIFRIFVMKLKKRNEIKKRNELGFSLNDVADQVFVFYICVYFRNQCVFQKIFILISLFFQLGCAKKQSRFTSTFCFFFTS